MDKPQSPLSIRPINAWNFILDVHLILRLRYLMCKRPELGIGRPGFQSWLCTKRLCDVGETLHSATWLLLYEVTGVTSEALFRSHAVP